MTETFETELLAPAGNLATGIVAIDAGADAVYAGLARFNARERTENLSLEEFGKLVVYAHGKGRKVYLTLNTLVRQDELIDVARLVEDVLPFNPDAIIVQDLGVLRLLREYFPTLAIHASTQAGSHNSAAVNLLAERGVERVILQRQIPLDEIAAIVDHATIPIEVFCHGALCCSLSGTCFFSSWIGGWSGNRGRCKQPCRRRYFSNQGNGFFFSTRDLYGLEHVRQLREIGVASLKIEGRLRKSDYVERAVQAYRMMLDCPEESVPETLKTARAVLAGALGRRWSSGFLDKDGFTDIIESESLGGAGQLCGQVARVKKTGFDVQLNHRLHLGDRIRVQPPDGEEGVPLTVTKLFVAGRQSKRGKRGETCFIPFAGPVPERGLVFRIGQPERDVSTTIAALASSEGLPVRLTVGITATDIRVNVSWPGGETCWKRQTTFDTARTIGLEPAFVADEFRKAPAPEFIPVSVSATIDGQLFAQARDLRQLRREFWEWLAAAGVPDGQLATRALDTPRIVATPMTPLGTPPRRSVRVRRGEKPSLPGAAAVRSIYEKHAPYDEVALPDFCPEGALRDLRLRLRESVARGVKRFRVTSLYGMALIRELERNVEVTTCPPLPVCNAMAAMELAAMGATRFCAWLELGKSDIERLYALLGDRLELYVFGRPPLMTTRAKLPVDGEISDARGNRFRIVREGELTRVYPDTPLSISAPEGVSLYFDLTHARLGEKSHATFNYHREFV